WLQDALPHITQPCFSLGIWSDVPAGVDAPYSHPGNQLWTGSFTNYTECLYAGLGPPGSTNGIEQFFDPNMNQIIGNDNLIWQYTLDILTNAFYQTNGTIYWLSVSADCFATNVVYTNIFYTNSTAIAT